MSKQQDDIKGKFETSIKKMRLVHAEQIRSFSYLKGEPRPTIAWHYYGLMAEVVVGGGLTD